MSSFHPSSTLDQAIACHRAGRLAEAEALYRKVLAQNPQNADALHRLGTLAYQVGQSAVAVQLISHAIEINPSDADYHCNLGLVFASQQQFDRAIPSYQRAIKLNPNLADAYFNLGNAYLDLRLLDNAIVSYDKAISIKPDLVGAHHNLGTAMKSQGLLDEAITSYRRAIEIAGHNPLSHSNLLYALHFHPAYDAQAIFREHRIWNEQYAKPLEPKIASHRKTAEPEKRLKIGYLSPDLREHAIGRFLLPLLKHHDHGQFEIVCYSDVTQPDQLTDSIRRCTDSWRDISKFSNEQVAELIRADQIEILVDLTMHMSGSRLLVFAQKPAPVQVAYLAYCSTTGLDAIDWRITDPYLDPIGGDESVYSERSIRLPETYWCYAPPDHAGKAAPLPAKMMSTVTFACLNNFAKVTPQALSAWSEILRNCPNSRLILHAREGSHRDRARAVLQQNGIDPNRLSFVDYLPLPQYFNLYNAIDIALDPFPYNGGTTSCDAMWMGVPVISLIGQTAVGRGGFSLLSNLGLSEFAAKTVDEYVAIASRLAQDLDAMSNLRAMLRSRMQDSSLMNAPRFARNMEALYRRIWQE